EWARCCSWRCWRGSIFASTRTKMRQRRIKRRPARRRWADWSLGGALLLAFAFARLPLSWELVLLVVLAAAVGATDDVLGIRRGRNRGLRARTKFLATALAGVIFLRQIGESPAFFARDVLFHAGSLWLAVPHWLWLLLGILAITGTIHA